MVKQFNLHPGPCGEHKCTCYSNAPHDGRGEYNSQCRICPVCIGNWTPVHNAIYTMFARHDIMIALLQKIYLTLTAKTSDQ